MVMVGIKDVAALAGVSISTVSYVMTGKRPIGAKTRQRVLQAARDLGYLAKNGSPAPLNGETHFVALSPSMIPPATPIFAHIFSISSKQRDNLAMKHCC